MKHNPFKITESEKNRIKSLHEVVKYKPQIDSTLNYATTHVITEDDGGSTTSPQCGSRLTCCKASGQPYCPTGTPKSCPNNNNGYAYPVVVMKNGKCKGGRFSCDHGACYPDPNGVYTSMADCQKKCDPRGGGSECCCKNRETGQVDKKVLIGDKPCTCKAGWIQIKCESNTSESGCCCNCKDGTNTPMKGGGCKELDHIKPWTGPDCHSKGCKQACKGFTGPVYSESTYELPIRYGRRRMSESQLVKMIRRISEEQESELLMEMDLVCDAGACGTCGPTGTACKNCCEKSTGCGDCSHWDKVAAGGGKTQGYDDKEDESLGMRRGKQSSKKVSAKGRRDDSRGKWGDRGTKLNERKLTNIILKVMYESQMLNENLPCGLAPGSEGDTCTCGECTDTCNMGSCVGGQCDCSDGGMATGGGGAQLADAPGILDTPGKTKGRGRDRAMDGAKLNERKLTNIVRKVMFESQLLSEKIVCNTHADCPSGSKCFNFNDGSGRVECCAGWDRKTGCNEVFPESTTGGGDLELTMGTGRGSIMGGAKLNERKLTNIIRKVMFESQLLMEKPNCGNTGAPCDSGYVCMSPNDGGENCCCKHGDWRCCEGKGRIDTTKAGKTFDGGEYEEYDDYHTARGSGGDCAGRTCTGEAGGDCGGNGCVCDGEGLCTQGGGRTIRQQTSRR